MARQRLHINVQLFGCDHQICQVLTGQAAQQADLQDITWSLPLLALIYQISDTQYNHATPYANVNTHARILTFVLMQAMFDVWNRNYICSCH